MEILQELALILDGCDAINKFGLYLNSDSVNKDEKDLILMDDDYSILTKGSISGSEEKWDYFEFEIYDTFQDYILNSDWSSVGEYKDIPLDEIYEIDLLANVRDLSNLINLKKITLSAINANTIDFGTIENLEEIVINRCQLTGNIDLTKNKRLISLRVDPIGDVSSYYIDLRGMYWLYDLNIEIDGTECQNFNLNNFVLVDNYSDFTVYEGDYDQDGITDFSYHKYGNFYYTIEDFYNYEARRWGWTSPEHIESLNLGGLIIEDYSGIDMFTNLKELVFENIEVPNIDLSKLENLESVEIENCLLNKTLNFSGNKKLNTLYVVNLHGDLTNAVIDIRGMDWLEQFQLSYYQSTNFNLRNSILMDNYNILSHLTHEDTEKGNVECYSFDREYFETIDEYLTEYYPGMTREEIIKLEIWYNVFIKDYSGLANLTNLTDLNIYNTDLKKIDFGIAPKLENVYISGCKLNGTLDFSNNANLRLLHVNLEGDLTNAVIDIRGMDWLEDFSFSHHNASGFNLKNSILMDNYNILSYWTDGDEEQYSFFIKYFETIDEYLTEYYSNVIKDEIIELEINYGAYIKDYSGLTTLTNLTDLKFYGNILGKIDFGIAPKLENVDISRCKLNGTLDFRNNANLRSLYVNLEGDLANAVIDIRGLNNLEYFYYRYYTDEVSNFNLNTCILKDSTLVLRKEFDAESECEGYYYFNWEEEPEYPEYIILNLNTDKIDEINIIYGFVLNEGKLTVGDILSRNYFAEGITAKIFEDEEEITNSEKIVGTGTVIKLYQGEELLEEYTIVIYGDSTGDGQINAADALSIIKNKNQKLLFENKILEEAGRVTYKSYEEDKAPSAVDALAVIKYSNGKYDIDQRYYW